jgi:ribosomal protein S1
VKFLNDFHGVIDSFSMPRPMSDKEVNASMGLTAEGRDTAVYEARIVFVDHGARSVRLSMRPHVLELRAPSNLPELGSFVKGLKVKIVSKLTGILASKGEAEAAEAIQAMETVSRTGDAQTQGTGKKVTKLDKKMLLADAKRRLQINDSVQGVLIQRLSLADLKADSAAAAAKTKAKAAPINEADIEKQYSVGNMIGNIKVTGYHLVEGYIVATNMMSVISSTVEHWSKLTAGQVLPAIIEEIMDHGLRVRISGNVKALCNMQHLSDTGLTLSAAQMNKKFKLGQTMKFRVWKCTDRAVLVTLKKNLVDDKGHSILSYEDAVQGCVSLGVVRRLDDKGLHFFFFNGVKGSIPMEVLVQQGVADFVDSYRVGQLVKCLVLKKTAAQEPRKNKKGEEMMVKLYPTVTLALAVGSCDAAEVQSLLACIAPKHGALALSAATTELKGPQSDFVSGTVFEVNQEGVSVRLTDGRVGNIQKHQCTDFAINSDAYFAVPNGSGLYNVGDKIVDALVLSDIKKVLTLSMKPLLVSTVRKGLDGADEAMSVPDKVADVAAGMVVAGYIYRVESYGVMVRFRGVLTALVPRPNVADRFVANPDGLFNIGDSVRCVIQRVDLLKERIIASFRSGALSSSSGPSCFLLSSLREAYASSKFLATSGGKILPDWKKYRLGSVVRATISSIESYGIVLTAADQVTMMLARNIQAKSKMVVGQTMDVLVLDIDFKNSVLDVSLDAELVANMSAPAQNGKKKSSAAAPKIPQALRVKDSVLTGRVELVQADKKYLVVSVERAAIAYVSIADYHCPVITEPTEYAKNQEISLRVVKPATEGAADADNESPHHASAVLCLSAGRASTVSQGERKAIQNGAAESAAPTTKSKFLDKLRVGVVLKWRVVSMSNTEITVEPGNAELVGLNLKASLHVSSTLDRFLCTDNLLKQLRSIVQVKGKSYMGPHHPFHGIEVGSWITCRVLTVKRQSKASDSNAASDSDSEIKVVLSNVGLAQSEDESEAVTGKRKRADEVPAASYLLQTHGRHAMEVDGVYAGCITRLDETACIVSLTPYISSRLHYVDVSENEEVIQLFKQKAFIGQRLMVQVTGLTHDSKRLDKTNPTGVTITRAPVEQEVDEDVASLEAESDGAAGKAGKHDTIRAGDLVFGTIDLRPFRHNIARQPALQVILAGGKVGRLCLTEIADYADWKDCSQVMKASAPSSSSSKADANMQLPNGTKHGDLVKFRVLAVDGRSKSGDCDVIEISMRPSRVASKNRKESIEPDAFQTEGSVIKAFVSNYNMHGKGCFLRMAHGVTGHVLMRDLDDGFLEQPHLLFPTGKLVAARVMSTNQSAGTVKLSLKQSVVEGDKKAQEDIKNIELRSTVEGIVRAVKPIGVFINIKGTSLVGLSRRISACDDNEELTDLYAVGDLVRAKVLFVSKQTLKVSLGLKPSYFMKEDKEGKNASDSDGNSDSDGDSVGGDEDGSGSDDEGDADMSDDCLVSQEAGDSSDDEMDRMIKEASVQPIDDDEEEEAEEEVVQKKSKKQKKAAVVEKEAIVVDLAEEEEDSDDDEGGPSIFALPSSSKASSRCSMQWDDFKPAAVTSAAVQAGADDESEDDDEEVKGDGDKSKSTRTRQKESLRRKEEQAIRARELSLEAGNSLPERPEDFERLLLAEPSSSLLWVKYMSHYLLQADIDATRLIAEKALRTIHFKEEEEKLNVWIAYVNTEHKYGDMASLDAVFKRAVAESKGKIIHLNLAEAYEMAQDSKGATAIYDKALKKYKTSKKVWMAFQHFKLRAGDSEGAKALLARSLLSLSRHKHVEVLIK